MGMSLSHPAGKPELRASSLTTMTSMARPIREGIFISFRDRMPDVTSPSPTPPSNYRYTVVIKPEPGEWPPPKTPANRPTGPKTTEAVKNSGPQAKERGLCTKCQREHAKPNKAYCEQCCKKIREHRAGKKQKPNGPRVLESKPIPLSLSIEGTEPVTFPLFDQPDRQEPDYGSSTRMRKTATRPLSDSSSTPKSVWSFTVPPSLPTPDSCPFESWMTPWTLPP